MQKIILIILGIAVVLGLGVFAIKSNDKIIQEGSINNGTDIPVASCFVGGCSGQICSDQKDMMSTCEYKEEYACYKTAKCERQASGQCGWTQTTALQACLVNL